MYLEKTSLVEIKEEATATALNDYYLVCLSRQLSLLGRKEVHSGRAHFGIFGDGKELAQVAFAKTFRNGDWRSGYYRDQTFMLALDLQKPEEFFAMMYGDTDADFNPSTGGRNFNNHFTTANINPEGQIQNLMEQFNSASDISPTAGQMPRLLGLAQASKLVRQNPELKKHLRNNVNGNEVAFGSIGDASTSEGMFFETINAAAVMQVPLAVAVYDDGFGISVPIELQTTKSSISKALKGFENDNGNNGISVYTCKGWDYSSLLKTFSEGIDHCRQTQNPVLFHIDELTQPLGHSTSGSHEHYKSKERLEWENEFDCLNQFRKWLLESGKSDQDTLFEIETRAAKTAQNARNKAWKHYLAGFSVEIKSLTQIIDQLNVRSSGKLNYTGELESIIAKIFPNRRAFYSFAKRIAFEIHGLDNLTDERNELLDWSGKFGEQNRKFYNTNLHREGNDSALQVKGITVNYPENPTLVNGSQILNQNFDALFEKHPNLVTFGEDTGKMGDVNQGMKGMQDKYGESRVFDTGIRETTIIGQGIGLALRGFRPIAEIQYLDYLIYAQSTLSDDLASMQYRSLGKQAAPLIIRTRGHQLQGIWHAGSPIQLILGSLRGIYLCVPRNMTQAAGFYNTLLEANDPALVIEPLKGYNLKEPLPSNMGEFRVPLGVPEIVLEGKDITAVTYGWNVHHVLKAAHLLKEIKDISVEVIDVQTLMPFDVNHLILESVKKTNKVIFIDEDVPGGGTAYMMQKVLQEQQVFNYLDTAPQTLSAMEHRPAYGIDGEYFTKPNVELIFENIYQMMHEVDIKAYPLL